MARIPTQVSALLQDLTAALPTLLGKNLVGIYLYGSLTQRAFDPKRSDVDVIVVTARELTDAQLRKVRAWLVRKSTSNPWTTRLQLQFLLRHEVLTMDSGACLYQFGNLERTCSDGNPIIWLNVVQSGVVLFGPRPQAFLPTITRDILFRALGREIGYLREEISEKASSEWRNVPSYRAYAVLTVCRILYSFSKGTIVSKRRASKWALTNLPKEWNSLIYQALAADEVKGSKAIPLARITRFIEFADAQLHTPA
jgi:aminoglycoside adenylyltransferase-like protein